MPRTLRARYSNQVHYITTIYNNIILLQCTIKAKSEQVMNLILESRLNAPRIDAAAKAAETNGSKLERTETRRSRT
jgi:hypothetical protein